MTGTHRDTSMRLLVEVGEGCAKLMDEQMRDLPCRRLQVDEIWAFVQKKERQVTPADDRARVGHQWTFVAIDPDTKLVLFSAILPRQRRSWPILLAVCQTGCSYRVTRSRPMSRRPSA